MSEIYEVCAVMGGWIHVYPPIKGYYRLSAKDMMIKRGLPTPLINFELKDSLPVV